VGVLSGIGFRMSLFIAAEAFADADFAAAKLAVFGASGLGVAGGATSTWLAIEQMVRCSGTGRSARMGSGKAVSSKRGVPAAARSSHARRVNAVGRSSFRARSRPPTCAAN
jgi:hypothetical protein